MFISKAEKKELLFRIELLEGAVAHLNRLVVKMNLQPAAKILQQPLERTRRQGRNWSPEERAKMSAMMKKRHADAKAKKEKV